MKEVSKEGTSPLEPHINSESFYSPPNNRALGPENEHHIFFIPGNPGLIRYYHAFLACLSKGLGESGSKPNSIHIYGHSLGGFLSPEESTETRQAPYGLQQQIDYVEATLQSYVQSQQFDDGNAQESGKLSSQKPIQIILIGHSVGTYILLELIRRHREKLSLGKGEELRIVGGVLLFPTVTHLAKSPSGVKLGV